MTEKLVTIVMYHYVRPLKGSSWPEIKGLEFDLFREQLDYITKYYSPISMEQLVGSLDAGTAEDLAPNSILLTFDDGYADHYQHVFPELRKRGFSGAFYPVAEPLIDRTMLDVNKIHFVLAGTADKGSLVASIDDAVGSRREDFALEALSHYRSAYFKPNLFDPAEVSYTKHMLQHGLPESLRGELVADLFAKFVTEDEKSFADEVYLNTVQLREMAEGGMHIGSHGSHHYWLSRLDEKAQRRDIESSLRIFDAIDQPREGFTFCYPSGDYNGETLKTLRDLKCAAALTTRMDLMRFRPDDRLELARIDTNDLPKVGSAPANEYTKRVQS